MNTPLIVDDYYGPGIDNWGVDKWQDKLWYFMQTAVDVHSQILKLFFLKIRVLKSATRIF